MARQNTRLANIQYVPSTVGAVLTNPASTKTFVAGFSLFNVGTATQTIDVYIVPDSGGSVGTAGNANFHGRFTVAAKASFDRVFPFPLPMIDTNDTIQMVTTNASTVTVFFYGDTDV